LISFVKERQQTAIVQEDNALLHVYSVQQPIYNQYEVQRLLGLAIRLI
jgi:hypothetical protein